MGINLSKKKKKKSILNGFVQELKIKNDQMYPNTLIYNKTIVL